MRIKLLLLLLFLFSMVYSQEETLLDKIYLNKSVNVVSPIMIDSLNLEGKRFQNKNLLETYISLPSSDTYIEELKSDVFNYFYLPKAQSESRFYLLSFRLSVDKYAKTRIKVLAPSMFEVYINGKKEFSKTTIENSMEDTKFSHIDIDTYPATYDVMIKYMSLSTNQISECVKVVVEPQEKNTKINYRFISNTHKRNITIDDIYLGKRVTSSSISPNGQYILLNYTTTKDDGKTFSQKELYYTKTGKRISLTSNKSYSWMPLSNKLYYKDENEKIIKLVTVDPESLSESIFANNIPSGNFVFSPNEKFLIYTDKEAGKEKKGDLVLLESPEDRKKGYNDRYFIYKYDIASGVKQQLMYGNHSTYLNDISSDSRYLLYMTKEEISERPFSQNNMFRLDLQNMTIDTIWTNEPYANSARFSPDGKNLLIEASAEAFGGIGQNIKDGQTISSFDVQAYIMNLETKNIEPITKDFNPSIDASLWLPANGNIYFKVKDKSFERIYQYNPNKKQFKQLPLSEDIVKTFSFADKSPILTYTGVSISNSTRAYVFDLQNDRSSLIADPGKERLDKVNFGQTEDWTFTSSDGTVIDGLYYLPPNFDSTKKYPMIVYYYGGALPTPRSLEFPYPPHVYASLGYIVYIIQPSGTIGYGQEFAARHVNAWGKRTAEDIIEGTKQFISEHSFVNDKKIGCIGASYGGFMTMYLQTQTDLFAAAVSHAGISSISSYWGEGYWGYTYSTVASANSYPWNNRELYVDQSPLFNADKIKTPILLLHGTDDTNVPIGESIQMYTALKVLGIPVELIQVKGENHGIKDYKKRKEWNYSIYAWFAKWLQDDPFWWNSMYQN